MARTTPIYALPYPELPDTADVPRDVKALAERVEAILPGPAPTYMGTLAQRPAPNTYKAGTLWFAWDCWSLWRTDGAGTWNLAAQGRPVVSPGQLSGAPWSTPYHGMEVAMRVDTNAMIDWHLRYDTTVSDSYKWVYLGGTRLSAYVGTTQTIGDTGGTWAGNIAPPIYAPRAGIYKVRAGLTTVSQGAARGGFNLSVDLNGGNTPVLSSGSMGSILVDPGLGGFMLTDGNVGPLAANAQLSVTVQGQTQALQQRFIELEPIRVA